MVVLKLKCDVICNDRAVVNTNFYLNSLNVFFTTKTFLLSLKNIVLSKKVIVGRSFSTPDLEIA